MKLKWLFIAILCCLLAGCQHSENSTHLAQMPQPGNTVPQEEQPLRDTQPTVLVPQVTGEDIYENELAALNVSHKEDGYLIATYKGDASLIKLYLTTPDGTKFPYLLLPGEETLIPLTGGNGSYQAIVYEHIVDEQYAIAFSQELDVEIANEFLPFLYANQFVSFSEDSICVKKGSELAQGTYTDLDVIQNVYHYVMENVEYDKEKAAAAEAGTLFEFLPDPDETLTTKKGICFDFAALMCSMLRSQGIPAKLHIGYAGDVYHSWISTYVDEIGWIDNIIQFDGKTWKLLDPTFAASRGSEEIEEYIGDGSNYLTKYSY